MNELIMYRLVLLFLFGCSSKASSSNWHQYDGYKVYELVPKSTQQARGILAFGQSEYFLLFTEVVRIGQNVQIGVPPTSLHTWEEFLQDEHIEFNIYMENLQIYLDNEKKRMEKRFTTPNEFAFDINDFNRLEDINEELINMVARCPTDVLCETYSIGMSYEGRDINMLKIHKDDGRQKQAIWIDSGIHSGEWLPPATHLKILDMMTRNYSLDETVTEFIDAYDWYFLPIMNPDGYEYTWDGDRFWRKSRSPNEDANCTGTDLNRNFDHMWGNSASADPCSHNYQGSEPASEIETQVVQREINNLASTILGFVTLHSAAFMWIHPWGFVDEDGECAIADDEEWMLVISDAAADAVQETHGTEWERGNTCQTIYPASGTTMDYAKGTAGINYTCTPELRGPFDAEQDDIHASFEEIWNGIVAMVYALEENM